MRLHTMFGHWTAALAVLALAAMGGCARQDAAADVHKVAAALRRQGVAYEVSETAALGSIGAEGLRLTGPGLDVELYVIENEDDLGVALTAAARLAAEQRSAGAATPVQAYARDDLFVLVREEPVEGGVREALERTVVE